MTQKFIPLWLGPEEAKFLLCVLDGCVGESNGKGRAAFIAGALKHAMAEPKAEDRGPLRLEYNLHEEVLKIEGVRYSAELFRAFALTPTPAEYLYRIVNREDGVVTISTVRDEELVRRFEALMGTFPWPGTEGSK